MMRKVVLIVLMVAGATAIIACGSGEGGGDTAAGRRIFMGEVVLTDATGQACSNCHAVQPGEPDGVIGNNLSNVGSHAMTRVDGMSAEEYLRTSIIDPDSYLAANFQEGLMPRDYRTVLSSAQINDLVAYMLTLN